MSPDFPNTVLMWESTRDDGSRFDEIFDPEVKVLLSWRDVEAAVEVGAVVPSEAYALWAYWAAPGSPARLAAQTVFPTHVASPTKLDALNADAGKSGSMATPPSNPSGKEFHQPLDMKLPSQPKMKQGVPSEMRALMLVAVSALVIWAAGKGFGTW